MEASKATGISMSMEAGSFAARMVDVRLVVVEVGSSFETELYAAAP